LGILKVIAFLGNETHDFDIASTMLFDLQNDFAQRLCHRLNQSKRPSDKQREMVLLQNREKERNTKNNQSQQPYQTSLTNYLQTLLIQ